MSGTKGGKKKLLIIAAVLVVVIAAVVIGIVLFLNSPARRLRRQLDLGARYLSELKYDEAVAAYEAALVIDVKSADAYAGLVFAHVGADDLAAAEEALQTSAAQLPQDEAVRVERALTDAMQAKVTSYCEKEQYREARDFLEASAQLTLSAEAEETLKRFRKEQEEIISDALRQDVEADTLPGDVNYFLERFAWSGEFRNHYEPDMQWDATDSLLRHVLDFYPCAPVWEYPLWQEERWLTEIDPLGLSNPDGTQMYAVFDGAGVDWVLQNVFNCSQETVEVMREEPISGLQSYYHEGDYYRLDGGVGGPHDYRVTPLRTQFDGKYYLVGYQLEFGAWDYMGGYDPDARQEGYYEAKLEWKEENGFGYWSLHRNTLVEFDELYDARVLGGDERRAFFSGLPQFVFASGAGGWSTQVSFQPDGSFEGHYHDWDMGVYTLYECGFTGRFGEVTRLTDHIYRMELADIRLSEEPGKEEPFTMEGDPNTYTRIWTEPYGFDGGKTFMVYLPGTDMRVLPAAYIDWASVLMGWWRDMPETLDDYGLYNVEGKYGFVGME